MTERSVRDLLGRYESAFENRSVAQFLNVASYRTAMEIETEFKTYRSIRMDIEGVTITVQPDGTASITCLVRTVREPAGIRVKPIADAMRVMQVGTYSQPVQTEFGYHVLLLEETRKPDPPSLESIRTDLKNAVDRLKLDEHLRALREAATVTKVDASQP